jgi:hypothetical protein
MYLSFEAPSIEAIGSKVSKTDEGPILEDAMEPAAITMPEVGEPLEELAPAHMEAAQPATTVDAIPDQSSSLLDE